MIMRNYEYVDLDDALADGDEIAVIPPVSGGDHFRVHEAVLDAAAIAERVEHPGAGAVITFTGVVRDNARGRAVQALEYEAYPAAAEQQLASIGEEMRARWDLLGIAIEHRFGLLQIGEASVVIAVSSAHRDAAFAASAYAIQRIKEIVPIWKKEFYDDGDTWVGSESEYQTLIAAEGRK
jgi:molybdopterin synthase catalytic subunit